MQLHCLGTTGYHPNERRHTACYAIPEAGIVLDAGSGLFRLPKIWTTPTLDIFLTHAHLDHIVGLTYLLNIAHQIPQVKTRIWGEPEKLDAIREHLFSKFIFPVLPDAQWCSIDSSQPIEVRGNGRLVSFPLSHPGGSVGYRIDWPDGPSIAYVTDTTGDPKASYVDLIQNCDLLIHECYFRDESAEWAQKTGHTWTSKAATVAAAANAKRLLLIHINPLEEGLDPVDIDRAKRIFPETVVAEDGLVVQL